MKSNSLPIAFTLLVSVVLLGGITGCSRRPSDSDISDAVKRYCEQPGQGEYAGTLRSIKLPASPRQRDLIDSASIKISDVRVVKRGKPFSAGGGEGFPVRVYVKGMKIVEYRRFQGSEGSLVHVNDVNLPFEGETDLDITFLPPDRGKVEPGPGQWIVMAN